MKHITSNDFKIDKPTAVALGNFDGIHLGHKSLIDKAINESSKYASTVLSFYPHPAYIISPNSNFKLITTREEKAFLLGKLGIDIYIEYPFDDRLASLDAKDFAENILFTQINCKTVIVGENYRFGKNRSGDIDLLKRIAPKYDAKVIVVPILSKENNTISSTLIRQYISSGIDIKKACESLTYPYMTAGSIASIKKSNYITITINTCPSKLLPNNGIYLTKTYAGHLHESITSICSASSNDTKIVKTHLHCFDERMAGNEVVVYYFDYLEEEKCMISEKYEKYMRNRAISQKSV